MENQEKIWNSIAKQWKIFRTKPIDKVKDFLKDKHGRLLDLGCGTGRNFVKFDGKIYGVDFSEEMLKHAKEFVEKNKLNIELIKSDVSKLPFKDDFFDAAIFSAVLHCIPSKEEREKSLKELFRVLKPGAECWITVWDKNQERFKDSEKESFVPWKHEGIEYMRYYYLYDGKELVDLLKEIGFEIIKTGYGVNINANYSKKNIDVIFSKPFYSDSKK